MKLLIAGGEGQVGREFPLLADTTLDIVTCNRATLDITDPVSVRAALTQYQPDALVNAAAYTAVDKAESEADTAFAINATGAATLATAARDAGIPLLHISTDYVFDGDKPPMLAYSETDACAPQSVYGHSKRAGEQAVLAHYPENSLILRTSWVFGRFGNNFAKTMLRLGGEREEVRVVADQWGGPTYAADIARCLVLAARAMHAGTLTPGIYHYSGQPFCNWHAFAQAIFHCAAQHGLRTPQRVLPIASHEYPVAAKRPANSSLDSQRLCRTLGIAPSDWAAGLQQLLIWHTQQKS